MRRAAREWGGGVSEVLREARRHYAAEVHLSARQFASVCSFPVSQESTKYLPRIVKSVVIAVQVWLG
jgi:hypothetical protein